MPNEDMSNPFETVKRKVIMEFEQSLKKKIHLEFEDSESIARILPMLGDEYFRPMETERMFVGKINMKKETSRLIKELSSSWPLGNHLKRVRWTQQKDIFEILIRPLEKDESFHSCSVSSILGQTNINTVGLMDSVSILEVPKFPALTNQQYKEAKEFWPVQFREDKNIEKVLDGSFFSLEEKKKITNYMKMCINVAQYGDEKVGCVIVDPLTTEMIAVAHDCRDSHPIQHAVMVAVDLVARSQGGGSWIIESEYMYHKPFSKEEMDSKLTEIKKINPEKDVKKMVLPYLCTGYDAFISREPCVMCAMALVHSRIRRVFYAHQSSQGALGSQCKLHLQEGLNHHYEVFRVELNPSTENCKESAKMESAVKTDCGSNS